MGGGRPPALDLQGVLRDPWAIGAVYFLLAGGLMAGIFVPELRLVGVAMGIAVVAHWTRRVLHRTADAVDLAAALALVILAVGAWASTQPRTSVEFAAWAIALVALLAILRRHLADAAARDRLLSVTGWTAIGFAVVIAAVWAWQALGWVRAGGPGGVPPLQLDYPDDWFRNMNVLPVYLALMAPGVIHLWLVRRVRWPVAAGVAGLAVITLLSASRAAWLGLGLGALVFVAFAGLEAISRLGRRALAPVPLALGALLLAGLIVAGIASGALAAAGDLATLSSRFTIWRAAFATWTAYPIAGSGLGTITSELLEHGLASIGSGPAPHAHNILLQLLAEAGIAGTLALAGLAATIAVRAWRSPSSVPRPVRAAALGALVTFGVDGLADNHTALGGIAVLVVGNAALLATATPGQPVAGRFAGPVRVVSAVALGVVGAAMLMWGAGAVAWGRSQALLLEGDHQASARVLEFAHALDPDLALYGRELGKVRRLQGRATEADVLLHRAAELNSADPNTWRTIGTLALADGRLAEAVDPLRRSLALDATQLNTHLLLGIVLDRLGLASQADERYVVAILLQPRLLLSDGWNGIGVPPERLEALAAAAWETGIGDPKSSATRLVELAVVRADADGLEALLAERRVPDAASWRAVLAAEAGDLDRAEDLLAASVNDGRTSVDYWANAALVHELAGLGAATARDYRLASLLREGRAPATSEPGLAYPVTRDANDFWMYARSTAWLTIDVGLRLPDPQRGGWLRLHDPSRIELPSARAARLDRAAGPAGAGP